jgi:hypothetical protein
MRQKVIIYIQLLTIRFVASKKGYSCTKHYTKIVYGFHYVGVVLGYLTTF